MPLDCTSSGFAATVIFSLSGASMTGKPSNSVFGITHSQQGQQPNGPPGQYTARPVASEAGTGGSGQGATPAPVEKLG